jgi:hypothetical protein
MDAPPKINESTGTGPSRKYSRLKRVTLCLLAILAIGYLGLFLSDIVSSRMTWLTPAELQQASEPGLMSRIKYRLAVALGPLNRFILRSKKSLIHIDSSILALSSAASEKINLGVPLTTTSGGARAWILSPEQMSSFTNQLNEMNYAAAVSKPRIDTADGVRSRMVIGGTTIVGNDHAQSGQGALTIDVVPKVANGNLKLLLGVTDTEVQAASTGGVVSVKTNLAVACRVTVPNAGAVVIDGGATGEKHYWLVLSPVLVDASGKPIKH